ncbi:MAG: MarR family winged helix-turn-helix transcriptional regulator [Mesorhizobium sp.]
MASRRAETAVERPVQPELVCLGAALRRTANLVTRVYNAYLAPAGLEVTQYSILRKIEIGSAGSASELADIVGVERSTLARNLERLEKLGLVSAKAGQGRRLVYVLTPQGQERVNHAKPYWHQAQAALVDGLPDGHAGNVHEELALLRRAAKSAPAAQQGR